VPRLDLTIGAPMRGRAKLPEARLVVRWGVFTAEELLGLLYVEGQLNAVFRSSSCGDHVGCRDDQCSDASW
jgi:hypothetical protein